jgi:hypothetical protein
MKFQCHLPLNFHCEFISTIRTNLFHILEFKHAFEVNAAMNLAIILTSGALLLKHSSVQKRKY